VTKNKDDSSKDERKKSWSVEDEASWESFPASDPPSYLIKGPKKKKKKDKKA